MTILRKVVIGILMTVLTIGSAIAQDAAIGAEKAALIDTLRQIQDRARNIQWTGNPNFSSVSNDISKSAVWLARSAQKWSPKKRGEGQALLNSLERMLKALRNTPAGGAELKALLLTVSDDLRIKAEHCAKKGLATPVEVKVVTKRNGLDEVKGLKVLYIEKFLQSDPDGRPREFRSFSSPAVDSLVPGRYLFWAQEPGAAGRNGERKEEAIGHGLSKASVEVLTP